MRGVGGFTVASIWAMLTFFLLGLGDCSVNTSSSAEVPPVSRSSTRREVFVRGEDSAVVVVMIGGGTIAVFLHLSMVPPLGVVGGCMVTSRFTGGARGGAVFWTSTSANTSSARFLALVECLVIRSDPVREPLSES